MHVAVTAHHIESDAAGSARRAFWWSGAVLLAVKLVLIWRTPPFGDEAWYAWEARHLAWAYSDLPGLTAWLIRLGMETAGHSPFGMRWPFLLLATFVPWLIVRAALRFTDAKTAWLAGCCAWLLPLLGSLGFLALPDVPLTFAAALGFLALVRLRESVDATACLWLAVALVIGALSHYRFALLLLAGGVAVLCDARLRRTLREPRMWLVLAVGALAWLPLLIWNFEHHQAGFAFQLSERHPWSPHAGGLVFAVGHLASVGIPLLCTLIPAGLMAVRHWRDIASPVPWRLIAIAGGVPLLVYLSLAFFADQERVSFHWTLQAWLPWLALTPIVLTLWSKKAQRAFWITAVLWCALCLTAAAMLALPSMRERLATGRWYPDNFSGWREIATEVAKMQARDPRPLVADNFMLAAQLAFALPNEDIRVLDHPLNAKHGRAAQLDIWNLHFDESELLPRYRLIVEDSATPMKARLRYYQSLCRRLDSDLPPAEVLNVDHGRKRFLMFDLGGRFMLDRELMQSWRCRTPALAWIDLPAPNAGIEGDVLEVAGWAFKDGTGIARIDVLIDGEPVAQADYGFDAPQVAAFWQVSTDTAHPHVGFRARIDVSALTPGEHWLGLRLVANDGGVEEWPQQRLLR